MSRAKAVSVSILGAAVAVTSTTTHAADKTFDGGAGTVAGNINDTLPTQQTINYYIWDASTTLNWSGDDFDVNDAAIFNQATGTFAIRVATNTLNPASLTFTGGATYNFLRTSTNTSGSSNFAGWYSGAAPTYGTAPWNVAGADSFGSTQFSDSTLSGTSGSITLGTGAGSGFTGTVHLRTRPVAAPAFTGTHTIHSGALEIHDGGALPAAVSDNPALTLNGGTFAVNVDTGSYTFRQGNTNPGSGQLGGTLSVTSSSTLANTAIDVYGRSREQNQIWTGSLNVASGTTLTVNTGGGTSIGTKSGSALTGSGTIRIGTAAANSNGSNRLRLGGPLLSGVNSVTFDLGAVGILDNSVATGGTGNFGSVISGSGTLLRGSSSAGGNVANTLPANTTAAQSSATISIGNAGFNDTINGVITNGIAFNTGGGSPAATPGLGARSVLNTNVQKVGAGTLTLSNANAYNGSTTIATNGGKIVLGNAHALGDGSELVTVNAGGTLDFNGQTQEAGKVYSLNGGSLLNDNALTAATLSSGASASLRANTHAATGNGGTGAWKGGDGANLNQNSGQTPTVTFSAPNVGVDQATGDVLLQLGWLRHAAADGGAVGSSYATEPKITFSAPDPNVPGARPIKAVAFISHTGATAGQVTGVNIIDPGFGYTSIPTITIDNTGTGGSGFQPTWYMTAGGIVMDNGGSGYTSAPTVTLGGTGLLANSTNPFGGFGSIAVAATSNIGGAGNLIVDAVASGAGGLNKIGGGTVFLNAANTYVGLTDVQAGTLGGTGTITGDLQVDAGATVAPGASIESFGVGGGADIDGTLLVEFDGAGAGSIDLLDVTGLLDVTAATLNFDQLGAAADDAAYVFASYGTLSGPFAGIVDLPANYTIDYAYNDGIDSNNIAIVAVPEPAGMGLLAAAGLGLFARRRRPRA